MSDQNNTPPPPDVELKFQICCHDEDDGKNEFRDGKRV
jgi:hypothetical protein